MKIPAPLLTYLAAFDPQRIRDSPRVAADSGDLPRDFQPRCAAADLKPAVRQFRRDMQVRRWTADGCELIAELTVQRLEPMRHAYSSTPSPVERDHAVVDVFHLVGLDRTVLQKLTRWIERVVDQEVVR